jgi:hypothetical protein
MRARLWEDLREEWNKGIHGDTDDEPMCIVLKPDSMDQMLAPIIDWNEWFECWQPEMLYEGLNDGTMCNLVLITKCHRDSTPVFVLVNSLDFQFEGE